MNKTLIFVATLNEYPNIVTFIERVEKLEIAYRYFVIIDDNSTDGTIDYLKKYQEKIYF